MPDEPTVANPDEAKLTDTSEPITPTETPSIENKKTAKSHKIFIYIILIAVLIIFLGILAYINLFTGKSQEKEPTATSSATKTEKVEIEDVAPANKNQEAKTPVVTYCTDGSIFENKQQGYKVCLIKGWYTSEFDPTSKSVGFDSNPIPEASEYGGLVVVNVSSKTVEEVVTEVNNNLENETSSSLTVNGTSGTQVSGNIPADSFYYAGEKEIESIFSKFNRTYEVTMITPLDKLAANQAIYNDFLAGWRFLETAESPP